MVTVNFTILVVLGLFLVFLGAMDRLVFRPMLRMMDAREADITAEKEQAREAVEEAGRLERAYQSKIADIHRVASQRFLTAHRNTQQEHAQRVLDLRARETELIESLRARAAEQMEAQQAALPELARTLAADMERRLSLAEELP